MPTQHQTNQPPVDDQASLVNARENYLKLPPTQMQKFSYAIVYLSKCCI
jgi:hypothetical protein